MESYRMTGFKNQLNSGSINRPIRGQSVNSDETVHNELNYGLSSKEALIRLHSDMSIEVLRMKEEFSKRKFLSCLKESISFKSELSKMRWPSVVFMTAQSIAHFIVAFILEVDNLATSWVGVQGFILTILLIFNLSVNHWDTKLRFKELLMKSEHILNLIKHCSNDKRLLKKWKLYNWNSAKAKTLFIPKSPCVHQTLTYRDESCLNLPDYLLVKGDIIHLFPGERAPGNCVSLKPKAKPKVKNDTSDNSDNNSNKIFLKEGEIFHDDRGNMMKRANEQSLIEHQQDNNDEDNNKSSRLAGKNLIVNFDHAKLKRANRGTDFLMLSTPYIKSLRISLQRSHRRPVNSVEKECFIISRKYFETFVIPLVFLMSTIVTAIHYGYLDLTDSDQKIKTISIAYLLLRPSLTIMPFLPWMFPCLWLTVNAYGSARIICCGEVQKRKALKADDNQGYSPGDKNFSATNNSSSGFPQKFENLLATPTAAGSSENKQDEDEFQDLQTDINYIEIIKICLDLIKGKSGHVWRSSSLLQVLGCLTSLCCIDKVGILSWSNLTPEKVFVLTKNLDEDSRFLIQHPSNNQSDETNSQNNPGDSGTNQQQNMITINSDLFQEGNHLNSLNIIPNANEDQTSSQQTANMLQIKRSPSSTTRPEVLDISQTSTCFRGTNLDSMSFKQQNHLQFDDLNWRRYISNVKPLGLAIMMNNCCEKSFGDYFRFYKHICYESILRCNLTPVVKRRCICSISRLIGFSKDAIENYKYLNQIGIYKLIDPGSIQKGKLVSNLESTNRLKLPFPNMTCNIHEDKETGGYQVFSQGTADIILDACVEYWDGSQLMPLDDSLRKKIMDFYHRTSLTSYCYAFAYTPLLKSHKLDKHYVELPPENSKFAPQLRKLANEYQEEFLQNQIINLPVTYKQQTIHKNTNVIVESHLSSQENIQYNNNDNNFPTTFDIPASDDGVLLSSKSKSTNKITRRHLSLEEFNPSLSKFLQDSNTKSKSNNNNNDNNNQEKNNLHKKKSQIINETLDELTDQVFVGMVAMQYQACPDFVGLVEQLEHACIRFVHFSKENELRSRVFSEKMGLESGWNCHISLQSDKKAISDRFEDNNNQEDNQETINADYSKIETSKLSSFCPTERISNILIGGNSSHKNGAMDDGLMSNDGTSCDQSISSGQRTLYSWRSLPSIVMKLTAKLASEKRRHQHHHHHHQQHNVSTPDHNSGRFLKTQQPNLYPSDSSGDNLVPSRETNENEFEDIELAPDGGGLNEDFNQQDNNSTKDEGFGSLAFDMSNRAKLPKGIENIRPHLETIDNVPLQVSLFTDCTPELTQEMIEIMQEYGEIVCVIGSSSSRLNTPIFLQANASVGVEPLLPQCCTKSEENVSKKSRNKKTSKKLASKVDKRRRRKKKKSSHEENENRKTEIKPTTCIARKKEETNSDVDGSAFNNNSTQPTRLNNPRDRLGIGPPQTQQQSDLIIKPNKPTQESSSSSSSLSSSLSSSSDSDSESESIASVYSSSSQPLESDDEENYHDNNSTSKITSEHLAGINMDNNKNLSDYLIRELPVPSALAAKLASLPCSYSYNRKDPVDLYRLIMEARHFTFKMKNTFVCMICFALSISSAQFLASILFLPPMLSSGLTIWLTVVVVPLMSFSLMNTTMDSQVMKIAVGKNLQLKRENITFFVICYLIKFIPSIIVVVFSFGLIIAHSCKLTGFGSSSLGPCWMFTYVQHGNATSLETADEDLLWSTHLLTAQVCAAFLIVLYFVVISSGFVHRSHLMWQRSPLRNRIWVIISSLLIVGQLLYNQLVLQINLSSYNRAYEFLASLPLHIWVISFIWPVLVIGINLLVKRAEIKATIRQQRRARFDFNTKLGMNSPF